MKERIITPTILRTKDLELINAFDISKYVTNRLLGRGMTSSIRSRKINEMLRLAANMTVLGAKPDELIKVYQYIRVLVDADKKKLDFRKAFSDLGIRDLTVSYGTNVIEYQLGFVYHDEEE